MQRRPLAGDRGRKSRDAAALRTRHTPVQRRPISSRRRGLVQASHCMAAHRRTAGELPRRPNRLRLTRRRRRGRFAEGVVEAQAGSRGPVQRGDGVPQRRHASHLSALLVSEALRRETLLKQPMLQWRHSATLPSGYRLRLQGVCRGLFPRALRVAPSQRHVGRPCVVPHPHLVDPRRRRQPVHRGAGGPPSSRIVGGGGARG